MPTLLRRSSAGGSVGASSASSLTTAEAAWVAVLPCTLLLAVAIALLGAPLGDLLLGPGPRDQFWPSIYAELVQPEPAENGRYLVALLAPLLVGAAAVAIVRRGVRRSALTTAAATVTGLALVVLVIVCAAIQRRTFAEEQYSYFTPATLVVALALAAAGVAVLRSRVATDRIAELARETRARRLAATFAAALLLAVWLTTALYTDGSIGAAHVAVQIHLEFFIDEAFAIFDGQGPLVDFNAQYGHLWAYVAAGAMAVLGDTVAVYSATFALGTAAAMLAIFALLRRATRSSLLALALFAPVVAHGFFMASGPPENRYGPANLYSIFPIRYAGAYLLAWLTIRHLAGERPRGRPLLLLVAGLVVVNNLEFGLPALGATLVAIAFADRPWSRASVARLLRDLALGLAAAVACVALLTLAVAGGLPDLGMLPTFARLFGREGYGMLPMPPVGIHLLVYVTFVAALVVAAVRALGDDADRQLTAMLAWFGAFGLGAGAYFVGRSHPDVLISMFSVWAVTLALLLVVVVRAAIGRAARRPTLAEALVLLGFAVAATSLSQTPLPSEQIDRLGRATPEPVFARPAIERFVADVTRPDEPVAILIPLGHRIAHDVGVRNVSVYAHIESMMTRPMWDETVDALRAAGGRTILLPTPRLRPEQTQWLGAAGFRLLAERPRLGLAAVVDGSAGTAR